MFHSRHSQDVFIKGNEKRERLENLRKLSHQSINNFLKESTPIDRSSIFNLVKIDNRMSIPKRGMFDGYEKAFVGFDSVSELSSSLNENPKKVFIFIVFTLFLFLLFFLYFIFINILFIFYSYIFIVF